jgi:hypothetical protein
VVPVIPLLNVCNAVKVFGLVVEIPIPPDIAVELIEPAGNVHPPDTTKLLNEAVVPVIPPKACICEVLLKLPVGPNTPWYPV